MVDENFNYQIAFAWNELLMYILQMYQNIAISSTYILYLKSMHKYFIVKLFLLRKTY